MFLTATFTVLPLTLRDEVGLAADDHWKLYLGVLVGALVLMVPFVIMAERRGRPKPVFLGGIALLALTQAGLLADGGLAFAVVLLVALFAAVNLLEALLPSLTSRLAPAHLKGTALGAYATCQFLGAFLGGVLGGAFHSHFGPDGVFALNAGMLVLWLLIAASMRNPRPVSTQLLRVGSVDEAGARALASKLLAVPGVDEAEVIAEDGVAYLKVNRQQLDRDALMAYAASGE